MSRRLALTVLGAWLLGASEAFRQPQVRLQPRRFEQRRLFIKQKNHWQYRRGLERTRVVLSSMGPLEAGLSMVWRAIRGLTVSDYIFGGIFISLLLYKLRQRKPGSEVDPDAPKLSGFSYQFVAQTPEDEAKLKTMYCDDCGFTIFVAKNRFKKHFRDGLRCLNCGAKAPTFYNINDPDDPLNQEGATIEDFDEESYFADSEDEDETSMTPQLDSDGAPGTGERDATQPIPLEAGFDQLQAEVEPAPSEPQQVRLEQMQAEARQTQQGELKRPSSAAPHVEAADDRPTHEVPPVDAQQPGETNGKQPASNQRSLAENYKGKPVPADLQIFRDLDII